MFDNFKYGRGVNSFNVGGLEATEREARDFLGAVSAGGGSSIEAKMKEAVKAAEHAVGITLDSSKELMMKNVVNQKNKMILESRGNSAKKATDVAKEISF